MSLISQYYVFLWFLPLPVTPEKIEISVPSLNKRTTLVDHGEINILRGEGLKEISFEMLIPSFNYPFANYSFGSFSTSQAIAFLEHLKQNRKVVPFIITRCRRGLPAWWTNIKVSLEDFKVIEDANNGTDVVISVNLKEYKEYGTRLAKVKKQSNGTYTATFDNPRQITGNIAPSLFKVKQILDERGMTTQTIEIDAGTTMYNEVKKASGSVSKEALKAVKKANPTLKNAVTTKTSVKLDANAMKYMCPAYSSPANPNDFMSPIPSSFYSSSVNPNDYMSSAYFSPAR